MFSTTIHSEALLSHFQELTSYHVWALTRLTDWLRTKPALLLEGKATSSFPGIKATLIHMIEVEREWMAHMGVLQEGLEDELSSVLDCLDTQARLLNDYVGGLSAEILEAACTWRLLLAGEMTLARKDILQHCLNHSMYHRGQVVTIGHQMGLKDAPLTDYLYYCLKVKNTASMQKGRPGAGARVEYKASDNGERRPFLAVNFFRR